MMATHECTMSYFAISMHDPCQHIYLLVLGTGPLPTQPATARGPLIDSSAAVAPLSVSLYS